MAVTSNRTARDRLRVGAVAALALLSTFACTSPSNPRTAPPAEEAETAAPVLVLVMRHAEKATNDPRDPDLSDLGRSRARALADLLANSGVTHLFATEWKRTQQTLAPLAETCKAPMTVVGAAEIEGLVARLLELPAGSIAVVAGHSNTVPAIVRRLGASIDGTIATPQGEMLPDPEYRRALLLVLPPPDASSRAPQRTVELSIGPDSRA